MDTPTGYPYLWYTVACAACGETFEILSCLFPPIGIGQPISASKWNTCIECPCRDFRVVQCHGLTLPVQPPNP